MIEVEVKLRVKDREKLCKSLLASGYVRGESVCEKDIYYNHPDYDLWKQDKALRIRMTKPVIAEAAETYVLTYKGSKLDDISMTREEVEFLLTDPEGMRKVLAGIGFTPVPEVEKLRTSYTRDDITVCVDTVKGLGDFMEVEILTQDASMREDALARIDAELKGLGYSLADTTRNSYLSMLMHLED